MFTNVYTAEKLAAARQRELQEEAAKQRLLAELTGDRQSWARRAVPLGLARHIGRAAGGDSSSQAARST